jgi:DNA modification methylase
MIDVSVNILHGDCLDQLKTLDDQSIHTCITSPPYWGLRDYGNDDQLGLESSPDEYINNMVAVFREVKRVLRDDGTLWLNLGDTYGRGVKTNLPKKNLLGMPWRVALALQADGWILRQDIIWHKPNPMPESVRDRCTKAHEYIFLMAKQQKYYFDNDAIKEDAKYPNGPIAPEKIKKGVGMHGMHTREGLSKLGARDKRNKRSVWKVTTKPFKEAHFATFPMDLIEPCVLAGSPVDGWVLDPFGGAGTTGLVADKHKRHTVLIEISKDYIEIAKKRMEGTNVVVK